MSVKADHATLYMVQNALRALGILVTFRNNDQGVLMAERTIEPPMETCAICGHYRFTHLEGEHVQGCNGQCTCSGFKDPAVPS